MPTLTQDSRRHFLPPICGRSPKRARPSHHEPPAEPPPLELPSEPEEPGEPDEIEMPCTDDADWDVFIADDDCDPLPEPGDFWIDDPANDEARMTNDE